MKQIALKSLVAAVAVLPWLSYAATEADVDNAFYPYKSGVPVHPAIKPGMVINKGNVASAKDALDPAMFQHIQDGWLEIAVGPTTSFDPSKNYVEATKKNLGKVKLGAKLGELTGYVAGRPFPEEPDSKDSRAGEKLAWNFKYFFNYGDNGSIGPFYWSFRDLNTGKVERRINFNFSFLNYKHRVTDAPTPDLAPNPSQFYRGIYAKVLEPLDIKDTQLLIHRFEDDSKRDEAYLYLGFQRRVRRLSTSQTSDAFLGTDLMIEDFEGYNGRISDQEWAYKGTANILAPYFNHDQQQLSNEFQESDGYRFLDVTGKGGCFPKATYQLRKSYVLEGKPLEPGHPVSRRVYYIDSQTFTIFRVMIYDKKGDLWKSFTVGKAHADHHLPQNKGSGAPLDDFFSMVDVQAKHCTTGQFKVRIGPKEAPVNLFTTQTMRGTS
ncbi:MAG: DUF1329 domain-containing protein [Betaproteobacteria bacterium]|nr:DUF1329 domain-containing protein [Betaproteobacteria bacterium]